MKILITGAAGFIGSHIADLYLQQGHQVVIVDDLSRGRRENIPSSAVFYKESILSPKIDQIIAAEKPQVVNHQAAQIDVRFSVENPFEDAQLNILGSLNLLQSCVKHGVKKIIFASSGGAIYGTQSAHPATIDHPTQPESPYGITKLTIEKYLHFYQLVHGLQTVALRYTNVYGPRQSTKGEAGVVAIFMEKILAGESPSIYGDGQQTRDYVFVGDVAKANLEALNEGIKGVFHVATACETSVNDLLAQICKLLNRSVAPSFFPARAGEVLRSCLTPSLLQKEKPTSLGDGLRITASWFAENFPARQK